jgi:asparagine synthase (glutamine-hydrolysing)
VFVLVQGTEGRVAPMLVEQLARSLAGGKRCGTWRDERGRAGIAATVAGTLPEDAHDRQPLINSKVVFVCRARLDNRAELLEWLDVPRQEWSRLADSEILLRCYLEWQENCVQRLFGDFAFVALHRDSGDVIAAVDHFATFPLFYLQHHSDLIVSPQLAAVLTYPRASRELDVVALAALTVPKSLTGATAYRHIKRVPGGHFLIARSRVVSLSPWWQPQLSACTRYRDERDYVALASSLFQQAVESRLRCVGGVGVMMSGGLDSTLVAATAARSLATRGGG